MANRRRAGFTLLEAVVALAIVGLVAVGVLELVASNLRAAQRARLALTASTLARSRIARLEMASTAEVMALPDSLKHGSYSDSLRSWKWTASTSPVMGEADLYDARVTVTSPGYTTEVRTRLFRPVALTVGR